VITGLLGGTSRVARAVAALLVTLLCAVGGQVVSAAPAYAHAELVGSTPANGQRFDEPPSEVVLEFTEQVSVVQGAFRLLDTTTGDEVATPGNEPPDGATLRFQLPPDLSPGTYLVSWRVVSADSHPVGGAFSFGVGQDAAPVSTTVSRSVAPWPVTTVRGLGYLAFAMVAGALALALLCWRPGRTDPRLQRLRTAGIALGVLASVLGLLLEGPYVAGVSMWRLLDPDVMVHVAHGRFGTWMHLRVLLYLLVGGVLWLPDALEVPTNRWLAGLSVVGLAATFPGTGHAAAAGNLVQPVTDAFHALAAAVWVGGLIALVVLSMSRESRPGPELFARFSRVALASVLLLVATGSVTAILELRAWDDLWDSTYGLLLSVKLLLVGAVLGVASLSRRSVGIGGSPWRPVRYEAVGTVAVLALTSALTVTAPPSRGIGDGPTAVPATQQTTVVLDLGDDQKARLEVDGLTTAGSRLRLAVPEGRGPQAVRSVALRAELPSEGLPAADVPLTRTATGWRGVATFALPGQWKLTLTVERRNLDAVVTAGTLTVR
jgi:copper transport protein